MRLILLAAAALLGCHGSAPATSPAQPDPAPQASPTTAGEAVDQGIQMLVSLSVAIEGAADCDARAAALQGWSQQNQPLMAKVRADLHRFPQEEVKATVQERMPKRPDARPIFDAAAACSDNAAFTAVWKDLSDALN